MMKRSVVPRVVALRCSWPRRRRSRRRRRRRSDSSGRCRPVARARGVWRSTSRCSPEAKRFRAVVRPDWVDRPSTLRCGRTGGAVPARRRIRRTSRCGGRSDASADRAGRDADAEDERLRGRSRRGDHDRSLSHRRTRRRRSSSGCGSRAAAIARDGRCSSPKARCSICRRSASVQTELAFAPGPYRYLRVTWDDTRSGQLPQPASSSVARSPERHAAAAVDDTARVRAAAERAGPQPVPRASAGGRLPIVALDLDIGGTHVLREATVFEARLIGGQVVPLAARHGHAEAGRAGRRRPPRRSGFRSTPPVEPQLDLVIDDGNNPPSDVRGVTAVFAELPWIYFESPGDAVVARYGNPSLQAPQIRPRGRAPDARHQHDDGRDVG